MSNLKLPERVAVIENCYKNLKQDLFGGDGKEGAFPALTKKFDEKIKGQNEKLDSVKMLFTNHLKDLKMEQEKKEEELKVCQNKWSRRKFDVFKLVLNAILILAAGILTSVGICLLSKIEILSGLINIKK